MKKNVLFISLYARGTAPSTRFRLEQYFDVLEIQKLTYSYHTFFSVSDYTLIYNSGNHFKKLFRLVWCTFASMRLLFKIPFYEYVFIHREILPFGPPLYEWLICKVFRKKVIYDFDDSIWLPQVKGDKSLKTWIRNPFKVNTIIRWSWKISAGNSYLVEHAKQFNKNVVLNPTCVDTDKMHNIPVDHNKRPRTLGWTGSHTTLMYLYEIKNVLNKLTFSFDWNLSIICNQSPDLQSAHLYFIPWNKETEIQDLSTIQVGLMPLQDNEWTRGKCGFKALQYMAMGAPALVSPVGVNKDIVEHGVDGYWCSTEQDWEKYIALLMQDDALREQMGRNARKKIESKFSVRSNKEIFLNLFKEL